MTTETDAARAYRDLLAATGPLPSPEELAYRRLLASAAPLTAASPAAAPAVVHGARMPTATAPNLPAAAFTPSQDRAYTGTRRALRRPADTRPTDARPTDARPADTRPADTRPTDTRPTGASRFRSHRAPAAPAPFALLGERGRNAVLAASLAAGIGIVGVSAAAAHASETAAARAEARHEAAARAQARRLAATLTSDTGDRLAPPGTAVTGSGDDLGVTSGTAALHEAEAEKEAAEITPGALAYVPMARKVRPLPQVQWVNPLPEGAVTSCFGPRWGRLHAGVDLAAPHGTPIRAAGAGTVVAAGPASGYGIAVLVDHGNGFLTHYGHLSELSVAAGDRVATGQEIGKEGSTGRSTGPHLHFEVHEGHYQNPIEPTAWLRAHGVDLPGCTTTTAADEHEHEES